MKRLAWWIKLLTVMTACICDLVHVWAAPLLTQLSIDLSGKAREDDPDFGAP